MNIEELATDQRLLEKIGEWYGIGEANKLRLYHALTKRIGYEDMLSSFGPDGPYAVDWSSMGIGQELLDIQWYLENPTDELFYRIGDPTHRPYTRDQYTGEETSRAGIASGAWGRVYTTLAAVGEERLDVYSSSLAAALADDGAGAQRVD